MLFLIMHFVKSSPSIVTINLFQIDSDISKWLETNKKFAHCLKEIKIHKFDIFLKLMLKTLFNIVEEWFKKLLNFDVSAV